MVDTRNRKFLTDLQNRLAMIRCGRKTPEDFYRLGKAMEAYRDFVVGYLDGLPAGWRGAVEDQLFPLIHPFVQEVNRQAEEAQKAGIIGERMVHDLGMLGISLAFVSGFTKFVI